MEKRFLDIASSVGEVITANEIARKVAEAHVVGIQFQNPEKIILKKEMIHLTDKQLLMLSGDNILKSIQYNGLKKFDTWDKEDIGQFLIYTKK